MKTILVTGATGLLGLHLIKELLERRDYNVIAVLGRDESKVKLLPQEENLVVYPCSKLLTIDFGHVDTLIHTAFSRGDNLQGLTESIEFSEKIIELVNNKNVDSLLNISTQGLYKSLKPGENVLEDGIVGPNTAYGLAKWAVENMLKIGCKKQYTNIRLASLSANARFLNFFVESVIANKAIKITAPQQYASIMDVADAVNGILSIENLSRDDRKTIYNLGPGTQSTILDYPKIINSVGGELGFSPVNIYVEDSGKDLAICMNCSRLMHQTGWKPLVTKFMMLHKIFVQIVNERSK